MKRCKDKIYFIFTYREVKYCFFIFLLLHKYKFIFTLKLYTLIMNAYLDTHYI